MDISSFLSLIPYFHETSCKWPPEPCCSGEQHPKNSYPGQEQCSSGIPIPLLRNIFEVSIEPASEGAGQCVFKNSKGYSSLNKLEATLVLFDLDSSDAMEVSGITNLASPSGSSTTAGTEGNSQSQSPNNIPIRKEAEQTTTMTSNLNGGRFYLPNSSAMSADINLPELYFRFNEDSIFFVDHSQIKSVKYVKAQRKTNILPEEMSTTMDSLLITFDCCYFHIASPVSAATEPLILACRLFQKHLIGSKCKVPWERLYSIKCGYTDPSFEQGSSDPSCNQHGQQHETADPSIEQQNSASQTSGETDGSECQQNQIGKEAIQDNNTTRMVGDEIPLEDLYSFTTGAENVLRAADRLLPQSARKRRRQIMEHDAIDGLINAAQNWPATNSSNDTSLIAQEFSILIKGSGGEDDPMNYETTYESSHKLLKEDIDNCFTQLYPRRGRDAQQVLQVDPSEIAHNANGLAQRYKVSTMSRHIAAMDYNFQH